jgi:long-chain acyl-CoA synthetase
MDRNWETYKNIIELFRETSEKLNNKTALRYKEKGIWHEITWGKYKELVYKVAKSLIALGLKKGEKVALIGNNRWEWVVTDLGIIHAGGVSVGLYPTLSPEQIEYAINHSEARIIFLEGEEQVDKVLEIEKRTGLEKFIVWDKKGLWGFKHNKLIFFDEFLNLGKEIEDNRLKEIEDEIEPEDTAFIIYTSGTTGPPKGAMITHSNIIFMTYALSRVNEANADDETLSYLPLNHIAERLLSVYLPVAIGYKVNFVESFETLLENLREVRPTHFFSVPRIWEKIASQIEVLMDDSTTLKKRLWKLAKEWGREYAESLQKIKEELIRKDGEFDKMKGDERRKLAHKKIPLKTKLKYLVAYNLVLRHVKRILGFDRIKFALCGAAPSAPELYLFFNSLGIPLAEGYGQTESSGVITITKIGKERFGYVGEPLEGIEVKIAEDGEILTRGPHVFKGYFKDPELTAMTIVNGWLHTGDVGEIDELGYLKILDRKKDIIITAGGKNITPSYIENKLKFSPYIQDAIVIGDGRKYLIALILIDEENVSNWAQKMRIPFTTFEDLTKNPQVYKLIKEEVEKVNKTLSQVETIKKFALIPRKLYEEEGDITPTRKLKRKVIEKKYKDIIEKLYRD